jgi:ATP-binding cassette subfamily B multidrug efflux pump
VGEKNKNRSGDPFDLGLLRRIYGLAWPYKKRLIISVFLTVSLAFIIPMLPFFTQIILDDYILKNDSDGLARITTFLLCLLLVQFVFQVYRGYLTSWLGQQVIRDLRIRVYKHLVAARLKYYDRTPVGTMVTRAISDLETLGDVFSEGLISIAGDVLQLIVIICFMFYTDWKLTLITLSSFPLLLYCGYLFKNSVKSAFQDVRTQVAHLNAFVQEHISGMQIVQIFNREAIEMNKFRAINRAHADANIRSNWSYSVFFPVVEIITAISMALVIWWGARWVIGGEIPELGVLLSFIMYIQLFFRPIRQLADRFNTLQMGMVASGRIFNLLDDTEDIETDGKHAPAKVLGDVSFRKVWFAYQDEDYVLKDISFEVKKGRTVALVGATGAGKSSIISLLSRFYEINKGSICLDGRDIREFKLDSLRSHIAVVLQDVFLFSGTIRENIKMFNPNITEDEMLAASRMVGADAFIDKLPGKYDFQVMERGSSLSVGQRQLISFVRALAFNPEILVLDEATSSVDSETEEMIRHAIEVLMAGRTSIVIAHRLSTIQHAHEIIVLDKGQIVERGSHQQLLKAGGQYRKLYEMQFERVGE